MTDDPKSMLSAMAEMNDLSKRGALDRAELEEAEIRRQLVNLFEDTMVRIDKGDPKNPRYHRMAEGCVDAFEVFYKARSGNA